MAHPAPRVGVIFWRPTDGIPREQMSRMESLGYEAVRCMYNERLPSGLDVVMATGPYGSLAPLANQLIALPSSRRPALAYLMTEQLPNPALPEWVRYGLGAARSRFERLAYREEAGGKWGAAGPLRRMATKAMRYVYYGDLNWMRRSGILSVLAVWSAWTADYLRKRGFEVMVPARGLNPDWGCDLGLERDIPALWLGKPGSRRRKILLTRLRQNLRRRGVELMVIDGVERPYVFGEERIRLLNRTRIMVNLLREPWDDNTLRFGLATANQVMIVSEPMLPHSQFEPGVHFVAASVEQMAEVICRYLQEEGERRRIVENAFRLASSIPPGEGIREIVERALQARMP
jgi:hypothetical protein